jgi:hypothetical protein
MRLARRAAVPLALSLAAVLFAFMVNALTQNALLRDAMAPSDAAPPDFDHVALEPPIM